MLSEVRRPTNKNKLLKALSTMGNFEFEIVELSSNNDEQEALKALKRFLRKGPFSLILIRKKK